MLEYHVIAIAVKPTVEDDCSLVGSIDGRTNGSGNINALMHHAVADAEGGRYDAGGDRPREFAIGARRSPLLGESESGGCGEAAAGNQDRLTDPQVARVTETVSLHQALGTYTVGMGDVIDGLAA